MDKSNTPLSKHPNTPLFVRSQTVTNTPLRNCTITIFLGEGEEGEGVFVCWERESFSIALSLTLSPLKDQTLHLIHHLPKTKVSSISPSYFVLIICSFNIKRYSTYFILFIIFNINCPMLCGEWNPLPKLLKSVPYVTETANGGKGEWNPDLCFSRNSSQLFVIIFDPMRASQKTPKWRMDATYWEENLWEIYRLFKNFGLQIYFWVFKFGNHTFIL